MSNIIDFTHAEIAEDADYTAVSESARAADDHIALDAIGHPNHWANFTVSAPAANRLKIENGRLWKSGEVYSLDGFIEIDMLQNSRLPTVAGDERWLAILVRGTEETETANRLIETDVETGDTVATQVPKVRKRTVYFTETQGIAGPTPVKPEIPAGDCCLCFVRLSLGSGIVAIEASPDHRVKTLYEVEGRVTILEGQVSIAFERTKSLQDDLNNLQASLKDFAKNARVNQLARDMAKTVRVLGLPDDARGYFYDAGLVKDQWAVGDAQWLARVDEGIRFAFASQRDEQLSLLDEAQETIKVAQNVLLPNWAETARITVSGNDGTKNISQEVHTETTAVERQVARSAVSYGPTVAMCDNVSEWAQIGTAREGQQFQAAGETFEKIGEIDASYAGSTLDADVFNAVHGSSYGTDEFIMHNATADQYGHRTIYAARSVQHSYWTETYWDYVTETFGVLGSIYGQTFLLTQPMVLTSIDLTFDRVDTDGNVTLVLCEVPDRGLPDLDKVLARSTLTPAQISKGKVRFPFKPRYLAPGRRYAWYTVTLGNYSLVHVSGSQFTQGSMFWSTDGALIVGNPEDDFVFTVNGAAFTGNRVVIEFDPLELENGMTQIDLLYGNWTPDGTSMIWEVKPSGADEWRPLRGETDDDPNPLRGLPALCRLRLIMNYTASVAPALILDNKARGVTSRPRGDSRAITKVLDFGYETTEISVDLTIDQYDDAFHTVAPIIKIGATEYPAETASLSRDLSKITKRHMRATYTVPATQTAELIIDQDTTTVQSVCFIENASLYAY